MPDFSQDIEFEWDRGNLDKNRFKHNVTNQECELSFTNQNALVSQDVKHSYEAEQRFQLLAKSTIKRYLSIIFTYRGSEIRVISARDMNKKERNRYEKI